LSFLSTTIEICGTSSFLPWILIGTTILVDLPWLPAEAAAAAVTSRSRSPHAS